MTMMLDDGDAADAELIGRARDGDRAAFGALIERYYDFVHRVAWRWSGNRTDAEDIAQEVCIRIGRSIRAYKGDGAFTTWLYAMTLNAVRDMARKNVRETTKAKAYGAEFLTVVEADGMAEDETEALWRCVRALPARQQDAVLFVYGEGLTHAVAAEAMGISEATVSWHIHEAKKRLKVLMRQAGEV
ncbi:RNA polymerase sigma factor [Aquamicrobium ahrensii]|uniref:RNA polymerase sigma-70 factor (ECF subfamily) n=1 Tax=Aquamicrobium ahrensii TaxID=469551 RepID=A0ABV2KJK0_9HYPH